MKKQGPKKSGDGPEPSKPKIVSVANLDLTQEPILICRREPEAPKRDECPYSQPSGATGPSGQNTGSLWGNPDYKKTGGKPLPQVPPPAPASKTPGPKPKEGRTLDLSEVRSIHFQRTRDGKNMNYTWENPNYKEPDVPSAPPPKRLGFWDRLKEVFGIRK